MKYWESGRNSYVFLLLIMLTAALIDFEISYPDNASEKLASYGLKFELFYIFAIVLCVIYLLYRVGVMKKLNKF